MDKEDTELSALVKAQASYYEAPGGMHDSISAALVEIKKSPAEKTKVAPSVKSAWRRWWEKSSWNTNAWGMGGAFAMGLVIALVGMSAYNLHGQDDSLSDQVVDSHVRSLMVAHISDVVSTDQHTVKPWFDGKLNYSPPVHDLAADGFPLAGGRLDYVDGHAVAALVYRRRLHAINVFVWPVKSKSSSVSPSSSKQGFNVESWQSNGMEFWAVSDVPAWELQAFVQTLRDHDKNQ